MVCRSCGTEIAEKALICYRCGTSTTEAKFKPYTPPRGTSILGPVTLALALVVVVLMVLYFRAMERGESAPALVWAMGGIGVVLLVLRVIMARRRG